MRSVSLVLLALLAMSLEATAQQSPVRPPKDTSNDIEILTVIRGNEFRAERAASRDSLLAQLSSAHLRWQKQGSPRISYRLTIACVCISFPPLPKYTTIEAAGDSVLAVTDQQGRPARSFYPKEGRPSVPWLFAYAEEVIRGDADKLIVTFDPVFGIPTRIRVDPKLFTTDDERDITVSHISLTP